MGNYTSNNVTHGYLKDTGGTFLPINVSNSTSTFTGGINNAGEIVGTFVDMAGKTHGYLRDTGGMFHTIDVPSIPPFNSTLTEANGINLGAGQQIVGDYVDNSSTPKTHGYLKNGTIFTTIDFPNVPFTELYGITNAGKIVGIYEANNATHGFLTTDMGLTFTQIDFSNSTLKTFANDINNADRIVGSYRDNPTADLFHGYFADPVPEPSTLALVAAGMASFALRRLRRKAGV